MSGTIANGHASALALGAAAGGAQCDRRAADLPSHRKPKLGGFLVTPPPTAAFKVVRRATTA